MSQARKSETDIAPEPPSSARPRVGLLSAWFDPSNPSVWSGVPHKIATELERLGVYAGHRNVTPFEAPARLVYRWMKLTGRKHGWVLTPEMRALATVSDTIRRWTTPRDIDGWIHFVGGFSQVVRARYVTFFEMSPSQLMDAERAWPHSFGYPAKLTPRRQAWVAGRQTHAHRHAYACCVASRWAADSLIRDHGIEAKRIHVAGYGRNVDIQPPDARDWSTPRFLFVGNDWRRKNGDAVVRAFQRVRREVPNARLDVVSNHPEINVEGVVGHGRITSGPLAVFDPAARTGLEDLFKAATCFVLPSNFEPFGIVYTEAAAAGIASIAGSIGGTADSVGEGGMIVAPGDDDAIYRAMREMCDPDRAQALGATALDRSAAFTWSAVGQRVYRALDLGAPEGELAAFL